MRSKGIVLSLENFGEADRYVRFFTKDWGMISTLAKAARKSKRRYVGGLDLFCHDEIFVRGDPRDKPYLVELTVLNSFTGLRNNIEKLLTAGKVVHWVRKLANVATPMPSVYSLLGQTLALITAEESEERLELLSLVFRLKLLQRLGFKPSLEHCVQCSENASRQWAFDIARGGLLCERCRSSRSAFDLPVLSLEEQNVLRTAEQCCLASWQKVNPPHRSTHRLLQLITQFASYHTGCSLGATQK